jgi:hypothetical protein
MDFITGILQGVARLLFTVGGCGRIVVLLLALVACVAIAAVWLLGRGG